MTTNPTANAAMALIQSTEKEDERVALYTSVIAPGAPPAMVALVYHYAKWLRLDPLRRDVMLISFDRKDGDRWVKDWAVLVSVHGLLKLVGREKDYAGVLSGVVYPGEQCRISADGTVTHEYDVIERAESAAAAKKAGVAFVPVGAYCTIIRHLHGVPVKVTSYIPFEECAQYKSVFEKQNGRNVYKGRELRAVWATRPSWMNEKCAIAFTCRKAYDHVIGRVYAPEEVGLLSGEDGGEIVVPEGSSDSTAEVVIEERDVTTALAEPAERPVRRDAEMGQPELFETMRGDDAPVDDGIANPPDPASVEAETLSARLERFMRKSRYGTKLFDGKRNFVRFDGAAEAWVVDRDLCKAITGDATFSVRVADLGSEDLLKAIVALSKILNEKEANRG